jgi:hypothetical protein
MRDELSFRPLVRASFKRSFGLFTFRRGFISRAGFCLSSFPTIRAAADPRASGVRDFLPCSRGKNVLTRLLNGHILRGSKAPLSMLMDRGLAIQP